MTKLEQVCGGALPKLVMFDLDGTLVDSLPDLTKAVNKTLQHLGKNKVSEDKVKVWVGNGAKVLIRRALAGDFNHKNITVDEEEKAHSLFMQFYGEHQQTKLYPGVLDFLKYLHKNKIKMAIISNKPEQFLVPLLDFLQITRFFQWIIGGDTLPQQKPDPTALHLVLKMGKVAANSALFVGDSVNDVLAAKAAKVPCVAVSYGYNYGVNIAAENPNLVVDDLRELFPFKAKTKNNLRTKLSQFFKSKI